MLRLVIRSVLFGYVSIYATQFVIGGMKFSGNELHTTVLVVLAIVILNIFMIPIFKILSLPYVGITFLFLNFVLTLVTLYVLTMFIPTFEIGHTELSQLRIFGFVLPSKELTAMWSVVYNSLMVSMVYHTLEWLCDKR
jgi:uncharacterized membrane protein YvlD (DUF360 family)